MPVTTRSPAFTGVGLLLTLLAAEAQAQGAGQTTAPANGTQADQPATGAAASTPALAIDCIEVRAFQVAEEKVEGQTDRAEKIPAKNLELIQAGIVKHLPKEARGVSAVMSGSGTCPNPATAGVLSGDILDFRKGNMALRYFVGFGAGSQKVRVRLTLARAGGEQIAQAEIADTKWAGAFGGTNSKGLDDFAEKAAEAAAKALKGH
jgi:Domain of unknown function (DUF4410)